MSTRDLSQNSSAILARVTGLTFIGSTMLSLAAGFVAEAITPSKIRFRVGTHDLSWRYRFWRSKAGGAFARLLKRGVKPMPRADADRPTEVIVGGAAASLFNALPKELRKEIASVPGVVEQLELRARDLRAKRDRMEAFASVAAKPVRPHTEHPADVSVERVRAETVGELNEARERVNQQLATTIAALETIRLDLLRLHAGRGSTGDLTAALNAAMKIGDELSITIESRAAAERAVHQD